MDSPVEGDGFELSVPGALGEAARARHGESTDSLPSLGSLPYGYTRDCLCWGLNAENLAKNI